MMLYAAVGIYALSIAFLGYGMEDVRTAHQCTKAASYCCCTRFCLGWTKLHFAANKGDVGEASSFLRSGRRHEVNSCNAGGATPLHCAAIHALMIPQGQAFEQGARDALGMIMLLLSYGADPTVQDCSGNTPMHYLAMGRSDFCAHIVRLVIPRARTLLLRNKRGKTLLEVALRDGSESILSHSSVNIQLIRALLEHGKEPLYQSINRSRYTSQSLQEVDYVWRCYQGGV